MLDRSLPAIFGKRFAGLDAGALAAAGRALVDAEFDNLILSHADRARVISDRNRLRLYTRNGIFPGTVLLDGFVAGTWRLTRSRRTAELTVELFGSVPSRDRDAIGEEAQRLLGFAAPGNRHEIRFAPSA